MKEAQKGVRMANIPIPHLQPECRVRSKYTDERKERRVCLPIPPSPTTDWTMKAEIQGVIKKGK